MIERTARAAVILPALLCLLPLAANGAATPAAGPETYLLDPDESDVLPGFNFRTGVLVSDNVTHSPDGEIEEIIGVGEFGADWRHVGTRFAAALDGTIAYRHYTQNEFDDEARANFLAVGDFFIIPETFDWYVTDRLANAPVNPLATTSPINVQFVNVLETGPRLTLRPGSRNELTIAAARANVQAEESPIDHERDTGSLSFMHDVSGHSSFGLLANASQVAFEPEAQGTDFEQGDAHVEFRSRSETLNVSVAAGASRVELADGFRREDSTGWIRIGARRTSDSFVYAAVERSASDTATAMLQDEVLLEQGGVPAFVVTGDPFFSDNAVLRYTRGWRAHQWFVAFTARELDYFISPLDRKQRGARLGTRLRLSSRFGLLLTAMKSDIEYLDLVREDSILTVEAESDYRIDRNWSLVTGLRYLERESSDPNYGFDEAMLTLFISYSPRGSALRRSGL